MKIVFVSPYLPSRDGIAAYTARLAGELDGDGHQTRVVTARDVVPDQRTVDGWSLASAPDLGGLAESVAGWRPDAVHVQFAVAAFGTRVPALAGLLRRLRSHPVRVIVTFHEVTRDIELLKFAGRVLYRRLAADADSLIVHTEQSRRLLVDELGVPDEKISVIPHPASPPPISRVDSADSRADSGPPARFGLDGHRLLLAFGFIHIDKGLGDLVNALGRLVGSGSAGEFDDVRLVVAGTVRPRYGAFRIFELRDRLHEALVRRRAARLGLTDRVVWAGYVPDTEIGAWFTSATVTVLPYRRIEESGVANIAAALEVPVLVSTAGGLAERFGSPNWSFPPRDPTALAGVLARFLQAPETDRRDAVPRRQDTTLAAVVERTVRQYA